MRERERQRQEPGLATSAINAFSFWLSTKKLNYKAKILNPRAAAAAAASWEQFVQENVFSVSQWSTEGGK